MAEIETLGGEQPTGETALVFIGARTLIGTLVEVDGGRMLRPAFDFNPNVTPEVAPVQNEKGQVVGQAPTGKINIQHHGFPLAWLASLSEAGIVVPPDAPAVLAKSLSTEDRHAIEKAFSEGQNFVNNLRAAQSGVQVVSAMPKLGDNVRGLRGRG